MALHRNFCLAFTVIVLGACSTPTTKVSLNSTPSNVTLSNVTLGSLIEDNKSCWKTCRVFASFEPGVLPDFGDRQQSLQETTRLLAIASKLLSETLKYQKIESGAFWLEENKVPLTMICGGGDWVNGGGFDGERVTQILKSENRPYNNEPILSASFPPDKVWGCAAPITQYSKTYFDRVYAGFSSRQARLRRIAEEKKNKKHQNQVAENLRRNASDTTKKRSGEASLLANIENTCKQFGYKKGTEKFADCMKDLYLKETGGSGTASSSSLSASRVDSATAAQIEALRQQTEAMRKQAEAAERARQSEALMKLGTSLMNPGMNQGQTSIRCTTVGNITNCD